jgi:hypothetical protein
MDIKLPLLTEEEENEAILGIRGYKDYKLSVDPSIPFIDVVHGVLERGFSAEGVLAHLDDILRKYGVKDNQTLDGTHLTLARLDKWLSVILGGQAEE